MRRAGGLWPRIADLSNLLRAAQVAARGKRRMPGVARFLERAEPECLTILRRLEDGSWQPGRPTRFLVHDPKTRMISAAPFPDRVVHHALIDPLESIFERRMIDGSYACRRGKGQHAAVREAQRLVRRHERFLKMDIRKCFESIRHDVVMSTLRRILKDRKVLDLCERILAEEEGGVGLPIGNLSSQWFANLVLDRLDHFVKERLRVPGYVRYMDDFVLFCDDIDALRANEQDVVRFLKDELALIPKEKATMRAPVGSGLPFLGFRIYRRTVRVRPENLRRSLRRFRWRERQFENGNIDERELAECQRSVIAHLATGDTLGLRRALFHPRKEGTKAKAAPAIA